MQYNIASIINHMMMLFTLYVVEYSKHHIESFVNS